MAGTIEEIVVTAKRRLGDAMQTGGGPAGSGGADVRAAMSGRLNFIEAGGGSPAALEEIIVKAKKPPKFFGVTTRDLHKGLQLRSLEASVEAKLRAAKFAPFEEVKVVAKRLPKVGLIRGAMPFGGPAISLFDIGARIADRISQMRLDEVGQIATRPVMAPPDTPVATIPPEIIPEIVVRAKRPRTFRPAIVRDLSTRDVDFFDRGVSFPDQAPTAAPRIVLKTPQFADPAPKIINFSAPDIRIDPDPSIRSRPRPGTRSFLLNIPRTPTLPGPGSLTALGPDLIGLPQTATSPDLAGGACPKCPKPKEKRRQKCFRGLTKQGRYPRNDKFTKWVEIDCKTKREKRKK